MLKIVYNPLPDTCDLNCKYVECPVDSPALGRNIAIQHPIICANCHAKLSSAFVVGLVTVVRTFRITPSIFKAYSLYCK